MWLKDLKTGQKIKKRKNEQMFKKRCLQISIISLGYCIFLLTENLTKCKINVYYFDEGLLMIKKRSFVSILLSLCIFFVRVLL